MSYLSCFKKYKKCSILMMLVIFGLGFLVGFSVVGPIPESNKTLLNNNILILPLATTTNEILGEYFPVSSWDSYNNKQYNFSLNLPAGFFSTSTDVLNVNPDATTLSRLCYNQEGEIKEKCKDNINSVKPIDSYYFTGKGKIKKVPLCSYAFSFFIRIYNKGRALSLKKWLGSNFPGPLMCRSLLVNKINGLECMMGRDFSLSSEHSVFRTFFFVYKDLVFEFEVYEIYPVDYINKINVLGQNSVYKAIVSSFRIMSPSIQ